MRCRCGIGDINADGSKVTPTHGFDIDTHMLLVPSNHATGDWPMPGVATGQTDLFSNGANIDRVGAVSFCVVSSTL